MENDTAKFTNHPYKYYIVPGTIYKYILYREDKKTREAEPIKASDSYNELMRLVNEYRSVRLGEYI